MSGRALAGAPATQGDVADSDPSQQQHAGGHDPAAGRDAQAADAWPVTSDEPTKAVRAIAEKRSVDSLIGMVLSRNGL